MQYKICWT